MDKAENQPIDLANKPNASVTAERPQSKNISFTECITALYRNWKIIAISTIIFIGAGVFFGLKQTDRQRYSTVVEIGSFYMPMPDGTLSPRELIESPEQVRSKLEKSFFASALLEYTTEHPTESLPTLKSSNTKESSIIEIFVDGKTINSTKLLALLTKINNRLISDHNNKTRNIELQINQHFEDSGLIVEEINSNLDKIEQEIEITKTKIANISNQKQLLEKQIMDLNQSIQNSQESRRLASENPRSNSKLSILLFDNEILKTTVLKNELEAKLVFELPSLEASMNEKLIQFKKDKRVAKAKLKNAEHFYSQHLRSKPQPEQNISANGSNPTTNSTAENNSLNFSPTKVVVPPHKSLQSIAFPFIAVFSFYIFLGLFIGIVLSILLELYSQIKPVIKQLKTI